ncbi:MAG: YitT family protein, partial [Acutalibacter sp.]|nr:YitT family protein [Acutalibacter sp.]
VRGATTGGTDMIARLLERRMPQLSMGKLMLALDGVIIAISAVVFGSIENAMYACIDIFVCTSIIDAILYGTDAGTGKLFFVMSARVREMGERVIAELDRTVTYLDSHGGYSKEPGETMLCVVRRFEVYQIQAIIREVDKNAFVVVGDAGQITGEGFRPMRPDDKPLGQLLKELRSGRDKE